MHCIKKISNEEAILLLEYNQLYFVEATYKLPTGSRKQFFPINSTFSLYLVFWSVKIRSLNWSNLALYCSSNDFRSQWVLPLNLNKLIRRLISYLKLMLKQLLFLLFNLKENSGHREPLRKGASSNALEEIDNGFFLETLQLWHRQNYIM